MGSNPPPPWHRTAAVWPPLVRCLGDMVLDTHVDVGVVSWVMWIHVSMLVLPSIMLHVLLLVLLLLPLLLLLLDMLLQLVLAPTRMLP